MAHKYTLKGDCWVIVYVLYILLCLQVVLAVQPSAVSVPVRTEWLGNDGNWSPVSIRVGTPPQWLNVFPSTASQETWVVGPGGCDSSTTCRIKRGGLFESNSSSTWKGLGYYELGLDPHLGFGGVGSYGLDSVALSDQISVESQIVGIVNDTDYWLGYLGLGIKPTNFTDADIPTFLSSLVNRSIIPSHSYGYTAGAYHRLKHVPSSLVLGGYDTNRFVPHNVSFGLDSYQNPVAALNSITVSGSPENNSNVSKGWSGQESLELLGPSDADLYTIDSSTPYLWLPSGPCTKFEQALGLVYDEDVRLYTFGTNASQRDALATANLMFEFTLADSLGSSNKVVISLPYKAFDLQLTYPYHGLNATASSPAKNYFPLRKSANSTQLTIGRVLLQESYLIVDYERNNFSISTARFADDAIENVNLVSIPPYDSTIQITEAGASRNALTTGIKIGIAIAATVILALTIGLAIFFYRRRSRNDSHNRSISHKAPFRNWFARRRSKSLPAEIQGSEQFAAEATNETEIKELPANYATELPDGDNSLSPYSACEKKFYHHVTTPIDHDPRFPVELPPQSSAQGLCSLERSPQVSPCTETFAYSPDSITAFGSKGASNTSSALPSPGISPMTPKEMTMGRGSNHISMNSGEEGLSYLSDKEECRGRALRWEQDSSENRSEQTRSWSASRKHNSEGSFPGERERFSWEPE